MKNERNNFVLMTLHYPDLDLSPPQRPHCVVIVGTRAEHDRPPRAFFFFFAYCYFYRDTQREPLWRREDLDSASDWSCRVGNLL